MSACTIGDGPYGPECGREPATFVRAICVHEHIEQALACDGHLQAGCAGKWCCQTCVVRGCVDCLAQLIPEQANVR